MTTSPRERWAQARAEAPSLQSRLTLLGVHGAEQKAVIEETLVRVLHAQQPALPMGVALFGMAIRVVSARRGELQDASKLADAATDADRKSGRKEDESVIVALGKLPFKLRAILVGVDLAQFTTREIALTLGLDLAEVERLLQDARTSLATLLRDGRDG